MHNVALEDTIAAISTGGTGGIGIVRMSGIDAISIANKVFKGKNNTSLFNKKSHTISYGTIIDTKKDNIIDEVLVMVMKSPNTYTKEDVVEIDCHGGILVMQKILELLLQNGARLAEPGEFTKRSFLNGRIDLSQAEAVIDLIQSKTDISRQSAVNQLGGRLYKKITELRSDLLDMIASIEAAIDYPEHDIEEDTYQTMEKKTKSVIEEMQHLLENAEKGKIIREGLQTVIIGKPNVGKSSLLNWFLDEERAIVTDIPGTTRDTLEEYINIEGIPIKIVDTAGIRQTGDVVEKIGVEKSKSYAEKADLILLVLDSSRPLDEEDEEILQFVKDKKTILLLNKIDLEQKITVQMLKKYIDKKYIIPISVKENKGFEQLKEQLKELFFGGSIISADDGILGNVRHKNALYQAKEAMERALVTITTKMPEDFISMDLQDANRALGEITGDTVDEEIINRIFTKFCLGK
ncbi:MAG TPA: tRNA uridine-5-carboxymethylaminomethyl(34) synthesis GTPase MnmE [Candidatus Coprocola pullicola]|nr:tRNA uridine-5-carboxymethylaminomethyl(34) synthesis GTPase MnmE [Candidatus Coprocola pullicola]